MTEPIPRTPFLNELDARTLHEIEQRIEKLEPLVAEYRELHRRRRQIAARAGLNRTSEKILSLLADYDEGLDGIAMARILDLPPHIVRSTCSDLVRKQMILRLRPGYFLYNLAPAPESPSLPQNTGIR